MLMVGSQKVEWMDRCFGIVLYCFDIVLFVLRVVLQGHGFGGGREVWERWEAWEGWKQRDGLWGAIGS